MFALTNDSHALSVVGAVQLIDVICVAPLRQQKSCTFNIWAHMCDKVHKQFKVKRSCEDRGWRLLDCMHTYIYIYWCNVMVSVRRLPREWIPASVGEHQISAMPRCSHMQQRVHTWRECSGWTGRDATWLSKHTHMHARTPAQSGVGEIFWGEGSAGLDVDVHTGYL